MILCLNLNAAIDKTVVVSSFEINKIHRPTSMIALAGGKGCNVARALKTFGDVPVVSGWVGGFAGQFIEKELHREGIQTDFVYTDAESRTCTSILDSEKQTLTEIYELGELIPSVKVDELLAHIRAIIANYQAVTLSGSLPPGVPADFYARVIEIAKEANVLTFFDSSGEALRKGAEAAPFFMKPNETEARSLLGIEAKSPIDFAQAAVKISMTYKTNVLLSMGANGAIAAKGQEVFIVKSPIVEAKSAVGSGDCMLAGLAYGFMQGLSLEQAVVYGVAAGTANTLMIGAGQFRIDDFKRLCNEVQISAHG
ncbi:MAG: 1-phosphofructokinase family hexose kinase [Anaerolineales bacterium]|nr:1-phosphofructokinase family hexose kinase [Anaerolineales bacterium]